MPQCPRCLLDVSLHSPTTGDMCPNCGTKIDEPKPASASLGVAPIGPGAPFVLFGRFWTTVSDIIFKPAHFFSTHAQSLISEGGLSTALAFAVIIQWLASFFNFIWRSTVGAMLQGRVNDLFKVAGDVMETSPSIHLGNGLDEMRSRMIEFLFGAGAIILTPFTTLLKLAIVALFVHAAVRFFMNESSDRPQSYSTTLKILAFASAPWILCIIPGFGFLLGWMLSFIAAVVGLREVYKSTNGRAVLAVVFPELLFLAVLSLAIILIVFLAFNVLRLVF